MHNANISIKLRESLDNLETLPAVPEIAHRLLALPLDSEAGEAGMLRLIEQDPQICAKLIGMANSPAFGTGRKVSSVRDASLLIGMKLLKSVAIGIATMSELSKKPATTHFDPQDLWHHSMAIAVAAINISREMPKRIRPDENQIFLAGLLHDIGLMALHHIDQNASNELHHQLRLQPRRSINELELELLGITHCQIGAQLVRHWNLPEYIADVVETHHGVQREEGEPANPISKLVNIAEKILPDLWVTEHTDGAISEDEWNELCIFPSHADEIAALVTEVAVQVAQLPDRNNVAENAGEYEAAPSPAADPSDSKEQPSIFLSAIKRIGRWLGLVR